MESLIADESPFLIDAVSCRTHRVKQNIAKSLTYRDACIYVFGLKSTNATNNLLDFPPTISSNENDSCGLIPVTKEMIQNLRSAHLANTRSFVGKVGQSSPKKKKKKQSIK
mmetsp:Transcript_16765/g.23891  ORF Transcript_16765/g.23891 Transcript_16765/m.23891 type:complete len:111 (+) Transcript_16765:84-416(+)